MSNSRLEKFIYAICSMEVSDLPAPLSRIEILWNCLITGETPDFEPQSRNEQYLMAMLGLYELENLPAPMSRGEKLLYKIAMGETDLSDVPGYLSRYEELLKYLIENGGIGFEYVLHTLNQSLSTLYQTVEKPVKSAILKGCTLVNLLNDELGKPTAFKDYNILSVKENTKYIIFIDLTSPNSPTNTIGFLNEECTAWRGVVNNVPSGISKHIIETESGVTNKIRYHANISGELGTINKLMIIEYQDGMENWDIPYFTGMQSVKMPVLKATGKNLCNRVRGYHSNTGDTQNSWASFDMSCKPNTTYTAKIFSGSNNRFGFFSGVGVVGSTDSYKVTGGNFTPYTGGEKTFTITTGNNDNVMWVYLDNNSIVSLDDVVVQVEESPTATTYEPHKSNILTVNEEVELRGIEDVKDTLDCLTGEVTERIGEIVLDGSEKWGKFRTMSDGSYNFVCNKIDVSAKPYGKIISNSLPVRTEYNYGVGLYLNNGASMLELSFNDLSTVEEVKSYLNNNNATIQYQLATESIKTVDLTTVDQDGQPTKLKTFNDISYVEINADNVIPSVDVEVATKISETLSTLGLEHHDISETQNKLGQTIDEQTENTDAAMIATTEIYEQTL